MSAANRYRSFGLYGFFFAMIGLFGLYLSTFYIQLKNWHSLRPEVSIPSSAWSFLQKSGELGGIHRFPQSKRRPFDHPEPTLWIGAEIPLEMLEAAKRRGADWLNLGWVNGSYELWLDGMLSMKSDIAGDSILVNLGQRLNEHRPLQLALKVSNPEGRPRADNLTYFYGQELGEGFYTSNGVFQYNTLLSFTRTSKPTVLCLGNVLVSLLFFFLWASTSIKRELFYMAVYTFVVAVFHLLVLNSLYSEIGFSLYFCLNTIFVYFECVASLMLAASFARRFTYAPALWLSALAGPVLAIFFYNDHPTQYIVGRFLFTWINPACYLVGALLCMSEYLQIRKTFRARANNLLYFALGLCLFSLINMSDSFFWNKVPFLVNLLLYRFLNFGLVLFLAALEIREYLHERSLLKKTPVSIYHRRSILPEKISGTLLAVDIKNSELLSQVKNAREDLSSACLSILWNSVVELKGITIAMEGDALKAFFDAKTHVDPQATALKAFARMDADLKNFARELREGNESAAQVSLNIRGSLVLGAIKPAWKDLGDQQFPFWCEASGENCFLESARLLEIEKEFESKIQSAILVSQNIAINIQINGLELVNADQSRIGKHGVRYQFSHFRPLHSESAMSLKIVA